MFEFVVVVLLFCIAYLLWRLVQAREAGNRLLKLSPEKILVTDGTVNAGFSSLDPPDTVVDELRQFAFLIAYRLRQIEESAGYLRNYVWEVQDQRSLDDIKHPSPSAYWSGQIFRAPDADNYGLWTRERDYDAGVHRAMSEASQRHTDSEQSK